MVIVSSTHRLVLSVAFHPLAKVLHGFCLLIRPQGRMPLGHLRQHALHQAGLSRLVPLKQSGDL